MKRICLLTIGITLFSLLGFAQTGTVKGRVMDAETELPVEFMSVYVAGTGYSTSTDTAGYFSLTAPAGEVEISFSSIDYSTYKEKVQVPAGGEVELTPRLKTNVIDIGVVVKTESKYEKPLEKVTVSLEVIKPGLLQSKNSTSVDNILSQVPGITIVDAEPQIRASSGYSFGAGSRVMVLVDDMPLLSGDAGRPSWGFLPIENLNQIEIIKGASSVLYGSSALSGVINFRTEFPKEIPQTKIITFAGIMNLPKSGNWTPGNPPVQAGLSFLHSRRIKNLDLVIGANLLGERGFVGPAALLPGDPLDSIPPGNFGHRERLTFNLRYRIPKVEGLSVGLNGNVMYSQSAATFMWANDSTGIFRGLPGTTTTTLQTTANLDPYVTYIGKHGSTYNLRTRWFYQDNNNDNNQGNSNTVLFGEFQYSKVFRGPNELTRKFLRNFSITTGVMFSQVFGAAQLYTGNGSGRSTQTNLAGYLQLENRFWERLTVNVGVRYEFYKMGDITGSRPVVRGGINVQAAKGTFIRASFGQGYRFPTIAERFIKTSVGPATIFSNPTIREETSWSAEIGIKQGFKAGESFKGFIDVAGYWQQYKDYIEFTAGFFGGPQNTYSNFGFRSLNTGPARVVGVDLSVFLTGQITKDFSVNLLAGYNYSLPEALNPDYIYAYDSLNIARTFKNTSSSYVIDSNFDSRILKYRFEHTAKLDVEFVYKWLSVGTSFRYNSAMKNIDAAFFALEQIGFLHGLTSFRAKHTQGDYVFDARIAAQVNKIVKVSFIVNNIANRIYSLRPLAVEGPRSFVVQCAVQF